MLEHIDERILMAKTERWGKKFKDMREWKEYNSILIKRGQSLSKEENGFLISLFSRMLYKS